MTIFGLQTFASRIRIISQNHWNNKHRFPSFDLPHLPTFDKLFHHVIRREEAQHTFWNRLKGIKKKEKKWRPSYTHLQATAFEFTFILPILSQLMFLTFMPLASFSLKTIWKYQQNSGFVFGEHRKRPVARNVKTSLSNVITFFLWL